MARGIKHLTVSEDINQLVEAFKREIDRRNLYNGRAKTEITLLIRIKLWYWKRYNRKRLILLMEKFVECNWNFPTCYDYIKKRNDQKVEELLLVEAWRKTSVPNKLIPELPLEFNKAFLNKI